MTRKESCDKVEKYCRNKGEIMLVFLYLEINVIGLIILMIIYHNLRRNCSAELPMDQRIFRAIIKVTAIILLFDSWSWIIDGQQFFGAVFLNYFITIICFLLIPTICFLWLMYIAYELELYQGKKIHHFLGLIPFVISGIMTLSSPWTGWIFYINSDHFYQRGTLFSVIPFFALIYIVVALVLTARKMLKCGNTFKKKMCAYFMIFPLLPIIGSIIQNLYYGISLIWIFVIVALLMIFIHLQNNQIFTDELTGLYNRRYVEQYLNRELHHAKVEENLFVLLIDLDDFKTINDDYGHRAGDDALVDISQILRKSCKIKEDFLIRFGGDEFLVVGKRTNREELSILLQTIRKNIHQFNQKRNALYKLSLSMGDALRREEIHKDLKSLIALADQRMYEAKNQKK